MDRDTIAALSVIATAVLTFGGFLAMMYLMH
jgi:hypothetical protein